MQLNKNTDPKIKKDFLLDIALKQSIACGYQNIKRNAIAKEAGVANGLISKYFGTMPQLKRTVMRAAVHRGIFEVVAQGLAVRDPQALKASAFIKQKASAYLTTN